MPPPVTDVRWENDLRQSASPGDSYVSMKLERYALSYTGRRIS